MTVLDELRDRLYGHLTGAGWLAEKHLTEDLRTFEAAHPKIVDLETVTTADMYRLGYVVRMCANEDSAEDVAP